MGSMERFQMEFDEWAATYDETVAAGSDVFLGYEEVLAAVTAAVAAAPGASVTDVGAGTGNLTALLVRQGLRTAAVEPSAGMRAVLARKLPEVEIRPGDFLHLPDGLPPQAGVVSSFAFHHVAPGQRRRALRGLGKLLAPSGRLVLADVAFAGQQHRRRIFSELAAAGRRDLLGNLREEFYPSVDAMLSALHDAGFRAAARQLTPWVWLFSADPGAEDLGLDLRVARPIRGLRAEGAGGRDAS